MFCSVLLLATLSRCISGDHLNPNNFFYKDREEYNDQFNGTKLRVFAPQPTVFAINGSATILPCKFWYEPEPSSLPEVWIRWTYVLGRWAEDTDVMVATGSSFRDFGSYSGRVKLRQDFPGDAALVISGLQPSDIGRYHCEVVDGQEDGSVTVKLELHGVVFPYQHPAGRYKLGFVGAQQACESQAAVLATPAQLLQEWKEGLNWCKAGWVTDGTVRYPITKPRDECGGECLDPGVRLYRKLYENRDEFDSFCFTDTLGGTVYYLTPASDMTLAEAQQACQNDGAQIAKVGQLYAAWKFNGLNYCNGGWLDDGSVRYPITKPHDNCGPPEPGVRYLGFPPPQAKYGVFCFKAT
ncbi:hyaluronan and proteoglycan link protein 3-like [Parambassis ranga]|uniref:Hyaluronan and proteoglycan link protein 3-like n=1 Tax=Parambassis ranga TaxID=210632 RepID=A0A6P7IC80_9TELE|nr:hyaluronan and proteoglycan link protein 3-like [Parambassis ranga]